VVLQSTASDAVIVACAQKLRREWHLQALQAAGNITCVIKLSPHYSLYTAAYVRGGETSDAPLERRDFCLHFLNIAKFSQFISVKSLKLFPTDVRFKAKCNLPNSTSAGAPIPLGELRVLHRLHSWISARLLLKGRKKNREGRRTTEERLAQIAPPFYNPKYVTDYRPTYTNRAPENVFLFSFSERMCQKSADVNNFWYVMLHSIVCTGSPSPVRYLAAWFSG